MGRSKTYNEVDWFKVSRSIVKGHASGKYDKKVARYALDLLDCLCDAGNNGEDRRECNGKRDVDYGSGADVRWLLLHDVSGDRVVGYGVPFLGAVKLVCGLVERSRLREEDVPVENMRRRMVGEHWGGIAGAYGWSVVHGCEGFDHAELDRRAREAVKAGFVCWSIIARQ